MTDNPLTCEEILGNYGNPDHLKLDNILDPPDPDEEEIHIMRPSHYFAIENCRYIYKRLAILIYSV